MAMQTLQQELETTPQGRSAKERSADAYADEVRALRERVAELEAELAATKAAQTGDHLVATPLTSIDFVPVPTPEFGDSEFTESSAPAVQPAGSGEPTPSATGAQPGFAQAWTAEADASSFEERVAAKAFFQASTVDEESRSWLLDD